MFDGLYVQWLGKNDNHGCRRHHLFCRNSILEVVLVDLANVRMKSLGLRLRLRILGLNLLTLNWHIVIAIACS